MTSADRYRRPRRDEVSAYGSYEDGSRSEQHARVLPMLRVSTSEAIVKALTHQILDGAIPAGTFLREIELADAFGVSRQSLRAGLAELVHAGLLRREPHRGVWVPQLSREDIEDLYQVRAVLEGAAVRRLVIHPPTDWSPVERAVEGLNSLTDEVPWSAVLDADFGFHRALVAAASSLRLSRSHEMLCSETRLSLVPVQRLQQYRSGTFQHREHEEILSTIKQRNLEVAEAHIHRHLQEALANALAMLQEQSPART